MSSAWSIFSKAWVSDMISMTSEESAVKVEEQLQLAQGSGDGSLIRSRIICFHEIMKDTGGKSEFTARKALWDTQYARSGTEAGLIYGFTEL